LIAAGLIRLVSWIVRKAGASTILAFTLLLFVLESLVYVLETNIRGLENSSLPIAAGLGLFSGWWLARSNLRGWQACLAGLSLGPAIVLIQIGQIAGPIGRIFLALPLMNGQVLRWEGFPDFTQINVPLVELWERITIPLVRLAGWSIGIGSGRAVYDPVATVFFWSLTVWVLALWESWFFRRRAQPLLALIPAGILLAVTLNYTRQSVLPLAAFLAGTLSLMALDEFRNLVQRWERGGIDYSEDVRFEMAFASLSLVMVLTTAAALAPSISIRQLVELTRRGRAEEAGEPGEVAESFGLKPRTWRQPIFGEYSSPGLPRSHLIGSGPELSEQVVMVVQLEGIPPGTEAAGEGFYWRGLAYDRYSGRGWFTSRLEVIPSPAGESLLEIELPNLHRVGQKVRFSPQLRPEGARLLYAAGEMTNVDQETQVAWRSNQDLFGILGAEAEYRAVSFVSSATEDQLRSSGQDYPRWVRDRYLALPDSVPSRVLGLGRDLTARGATAYDRALAIESYLRSIPYSLNVPVPPDNRDVSDYFLFDLRRGYCDYYATAMVVLSRAAGLPARLATGFAPGKFDPESATFTVTAADAHSWVEVYFPGYGWVEFEPTGGRIAIVRPTRQREIITEPAIESPELQPVARLAPSWTAIFGPLAGLALTLPCGYAAWQIYDAWSLRRLPPSEAISALYRRMRRQGKTLNVNISPATTPNELAGHLAGQIEGLGQTGRFQRQLSPAAREVERLAEMYALTAYSPRPAGNEEQQSAIRTWQTLHWRFWLARLAIWYGTKGGL
jgi:transglutaminase-like putative cysteine protease